MPCRDYEAERQDDAEVRRKLDDVTRMLCGVMIRVEKTEHVDLVSDVPGLLPWWAAHKKADAEEAKRREEARTKEIARLKREIAANNARLARLGAK